MKLKIWLFLLMLGILILAACQSAISLPTETAGLVSDTVVPTTTSTPTPSVTPSQTPQPSSTRPPTETLPPSQTPTATPPTFVRENTPVPIPSEPITAENADRLVELARLGKGRIVDVQLSPDRNFLIVQTTIGVYGYLADRLEEAWRFEDPAGIADMALTRSERWMAVATNDGRIALLIYRRGSMFTRWTTGYQQIHDLAFSYDGHTLAAIGDQGVSVWPVGVTEPLYHYPEMVGEMVRFTPDDEGLIAFDAEETQFYTLQTGEIIRAEKRDKLLPLSISPDGDYFTNGEMVWEADTGEVLFELDWKWEQDFDGAIVEFSRDSRYLALSAVSDDKISIWRMSDGEKIYELRSPFHVFGEKTASPKKLAALSSRSGGFFPYYLDVAFSPDSSQFAAVTSNDTVEIWDLGTGRFDQQIDCFGDSLIFRKNSRLLVYGDGGLHQIDPNSGITINLSRDFSSLRYTNQYEVYDIYTESLVLFSESGEWLFVENTAWKIPEGTRGFSFGKEAVLAVSPDDGFIYTFDNARDIVRARRIGDFNVVNETMLVPEVGEDWPETDQIIWFPIISSTGKFISGYSYDAYGYKTWDLETGLPINDIFYDGLASGAYSSQGDKLVISGIDGLWAVDLFTRDVIFESEGEYGEFEKIAHFTRSDEYLILVTDGIQKISLVNDFSFADLQTIADFYGYEVAISPQNEVIAVDDGTQIIVIDFDTGDLMARLPAHLDKILSLTFSPDGRYLATSSADGTVKLWGIP